MHAMKKSVIMSWQRRNGKVKKSTGTHMSIIIEEEHIMVGISICY